MNEDTLVTVHCYAGDAAQVNNNLPCYLHHGSPPVIIMSPIDSPVVVPGIICRQAGERAYIGDKSLNRQRSHLRMALEYPYNYFLMNDADSICVSPEIPKYLYTEAEDTIWSNEVIEPRPHSSPLPKIALQPPYFMNRSSLEKLVWVCDQVKAHPITPYIDHFMLQLVYEAGLKHRSFLSKETPPGELSGDTYSRMSERIRHHGRVMLHPVKTLDSFNQWREDYRCRTYES
jgi:hypothetical protein